MDPYNLKRDNRKKFQDKQRLKQRHATPSDRKYRVLNHQEKEKEHKEEQENGQKIEQEEELPPSNEYRYHDDADMAFGHKTDDERNAEVNKKLKDILSQKARQQEDPNLQPQTKNNKDLLTTKELHMMDVDKLNKLLGTSRKPLSSDSSLSMPTAVIAKHTAGASKQKQADFQRNPDPSKVPNELLEEQDFLDDLI